jgi:hypothetical protein
MGDEERKLPDFAVKSYRYLRLSIVVVVLAVLVSVLIERVRAECWQGSFSAYYYTPVHSMFVGALVVIGVCLIAIKTPNDYEDMLLNVAGTLAPVVAFLPTKPPGTVCSDAPLEIADKAPFVGNNVLALAIGGALAVIMAAIIAGVAPGRARQIVAGAKEESNRAAVVGLVLATLLIAAGIVWYLVDEKSFLAHGHWGSAVGMFVLIGIVVVINAVAAERVSFRPWYWAVFAAMVLSAVVVGVVRLTTDWGYTTLAIEALEVAAFGVFWIVQTIEHWDAGIAGVPRS